MTGVICCRPSLLYFYPMPKIDLARLHKQYYTAKAKPELIVLEAATYLFIPGKGDPSSKAFEETIQALYSTAYTVKFACKALDNDFVVAKLEGQWWYDEELYNNLTITDAPTIIPRSEWHYRLLIRLPDFVTEEQVATAIKKVVDQKGIALAATIEWYRLPAGKVAQMLHVGPFDSEPETLLQINAFMAQNGLERNGYHHEVYLSDFRKTPPEKLKTILREPVK